MHLCYNLVMPGEQDDTPMTADNRFDNQPGVSFSQLLEERKLLDRSFRKGADPDAQQKIKNVDLQIKQIVEEANEEGYLDRVQRAVNPLILRLQNLRDTRDPNNFNMVKENLLKDLSQAQERADTFANQAVPDTYKGVPEYVYIQSIQSLLEDVADETVNDRRNQQPVNQPPVQDVQRINGAQIGREIANALHGKELSESEAYLKFQKDEEWNNNFPTFNEKKEPGYYIDMTEKERAEHLARIELDRLCCMKRNKLNPPSLENMSKLEWDSLKKEETRALYEIPGVRQAMEMYVRFALNDVMVQGMEKSFRKTKELVELSRYRLYIREQISDVVINGWSNRVDAAYQSGDQNSINKFEERGFDHIGDNDHNSQSLLQTKVRDAEQIAFNLLYIGNTFESLDSRWTNFNDEQLNNRNLNYRLRKAEISSDLLNPVIRAQMKPLDAIVDSLKKSLQEPPNVGIFGDWAYRQVLLANGNRPLVGDERVVVLKDDMVQNFWTLGQQNNERVVYIPECYPSNGLVKSVWEEVSLEGSNGEKNILDYLVQGREIEWEKVGNLFGDYSSKLAKGGHLWEILKGKKSLKADTRSVEEWVRETVDALGKFKKAQDVSLRRWLMYASIGIDKTKRNPTLAENRGFKKALKINLGEQRQGYLNREIIFFPGDQNA